MRSALGRAQTENTTWMSLPEGLSHGIQSHAYDVVILGSGFRLGNRDGSTWPKNFRVQSHRLLMPGGALVDDAGCRTVQDKMVATYDF